MRSRIKGGDWPLIGRAEELELLREMRHARPPLSAVINGPAGVGKSRLAQSAMEEAAEEGWATLTTRGSAGMSAVPLGPLRGVLSVPSTTELAELTDAVRRALVEMRSGRGLLVLADDCQSFDEFSAGLLHQLVADGSILLVATARSGSSPQPALVDLWKDGLAERIELQSLSLPEAARLLSLALAGSVQDSSANRIWQTSGGNPLYLREVVLASLETGALTLVEGEWRWRGEWATGSRLQEIVASRFGRLDPDELTTMEMLSLAGSLPLDLVTNLTSEQAVSRLEEHALVTIERSGRRHEVAIAHRVHSEVLRSQMPALRQRALRRNLVDAVQSTGARRVVDNVRLVCWSLESGLDVDAITLALAADTSLFGIGHAIAGRLHEILPDAVPADTTPVVPEDHERAINLARAAYERAGGVTEGVALAWTLAWTGSVDAAEAVLADVASKAVDLDDRLRLALALAWLRFWGRFDVASANECLLQAIADADGGGDPSLVADVYEELAGIALNTARPALALAYATQAAAAMSVEPGAGPAAPAAAASLCYLGRCAEALEHIDRALPVAQSAGPSLSMAMLLFSKAGAFSMTGRLEEGRELAEWLRNVALERELLVATGIFGVLLGEILLRQGRPSSAGRILLDSVGLLAEQDPVGYRPWALTALARARALSGDEEGADRALDEARDSQPIVRNYQMSCHLAEIELHRLAGRTAAALEGAREAADWAREAGMVIDEAWALDAWIRLQPSATAADRLAELVPRTDSELVRCLADHARALADGEPEALLAVAERFAAMTAWWLASEAATAAARILDKRHQSRGTKAALRVASGYASHCEGAKLSLAPGVIKPTRLTKREREIATLAARGHSNKEIADRTYLSARTVENHLYHAYVKLGVTDRAGLVEALSAGTE
ncbi:MAG: LuxR C-terminal-related transcriptional regulator [Acidimicrobiales bacterium]